jgi:hypothetical protein
MAADPGVSKWSVKAANTFGRRSFMVRASSITVGTLLGSTIGSALFEQTAWANACGPDNPLHHNQSGESIACESLRNNNSNCFSGEFNGGCWYACPAPQRLVKCFSGNTQYQITFTDCCRSSCPCNGHTATTDGYGNHNSCCNPCDWHGSGKTVCRLYSCRSTRC